MRFVVMGIALMACGRVHFDERDDGGMAADVPLGSGPWGDITKVGELDIGTINDDPTLAGDQLEIYFNSNAAGGSDLYVAKRGTVEESWGTPQLVAELATGKESTPTCPPMGSRSTSPEPARPPSTSSSGRRAPHVSPHGPQRSPCPS